MCHDDVRDSSGVKLDYIIKIATVCITQVVKIFYLGHSIIIIRVNIYDNKAI